VTGGNVVPFPRQKRRAPREPTRAEFIALVQKATGDETLAMIRELAAMVRANGGRLFPDEPPRGRPRPDWW
jgi:hypothetical protein